MRKKLKKYCELTWIVEGPGPEFWELAFRMTCHRSLRNYSCELRWKVSKSGPVHQLLYRKVSGISFGEVPFETCLKDIMNCSRLNCSWKWMGGDFKPRYSAIVYVTMAANSWNVHLLELLNKCKIDLITVISSRDLLTSFRHQHKIKYRLMLVQWEKHSEILPLHLFFSTSIFLLNCS